MPGKNVDEQVACPKCGKVAVFYPQYKTYYCFGCKNYFELTPAPGQTGAAVPPAVPPVAPQAAPQAVPGQPAAPRQPATMGIPEKAKLVLTAPDVFFDRTANEAGTDEAFMYYAILLLVQSAISYLLMVLGEISNTGTPSAAENVGFFVLLLAAATIYVFMIVIGFISAKTLEFTIRILGGEGNYHATYKALVYGWTPVMLFSWVPYVGGLAFFWGIYLQSKALARYQKMSVSKAFFYLFLAPLILIIVFALVLLLVALLVFSRLKIASPL